MPPLTEADAGMIKGLLARGDKQHDIASYFRCNAGRIAEIAKLKMFPEVPPMRPRDLPTPSMLADGIAVEVAEQAILRAMMGLEAALDYLADLRKRRADAP